MRTLPLLILLAACNPAPPPEAVAPVLPPPAPPLEPIGPIGTTGNLGPEPELPPRSDAEILADDARDALGLPSARPLDVGPVAPLDPTLDRDNSAISDEQDFGAVSQARSIEEDARRVQAARERFELVTPDQVDVAAPDDGGPNVVSYALRRAQPVGAAGSYARGPFATAGRAARACNGFRDADAAQEAFLANGGPERDRRGLDPDGDGNACGWDPSTYRGIVGGRVAGDPVDATGIGIGGPVEGLTDAAPRDG